jgi:hypothetical protein
MSKGSVLPRDGLIARGAVKDVFKSKVIGMYGQGTGDVFFEVEICG